MNSPDAPARRTDWYAPLTLGLLALTVYVATASLRFHSIDEFAVLSVTRSLLGRGSMDADILYWTEAALGRGPVASTGIDGHTYALKDVSPSVLIAPLVWLAYRLEISAARMASLLSPLITAATVSLIYQALQSWGYKRNGAVLGSLVFAFGTLAWPYADTLFTQPVAVLGLLAALHGTIRAAGGQGWKAALVGGVGLGVAGLSAVPTWITLPAYVLYLLPWNSLRDSEAWRRTLPKLAAFAVGAGLLALAQGAYNLMRFGSMLETGYQKAGVTDIHLLYLGTGAPGLLFSAPRGLIWYAPLVVLVPLGIWLGWRTPHRPHLTLAIAQAGLIFLFYGCYAIWWGGLSWGPRFLVPITPALVLLVMPVLSSLRSNQVWQSVIVFLILLVSTITQFLASIIDYVQSDLALVDELGEITPPPAFFTRSDVLTRASTLPWPRLLGAARQGHWDLLAIAEGPPDWILLVAQVTAVLIAGGLAWWVLRRGSDKRPGLALIAQGVLAAGLVVFMVTRYLGRSDSLVGLDGLIVAVEQQSERGDGIVVLLPNSVFGWIEHYPGEMPDYGIMMENPLSEETARYLEQVGRWHDRIWLVTEGTTGGNPANGVEHWLADHAFVGPETWIDRYRIVSYTFPGEDQGRYVGQFLGGGEIALDNASIEVGERVGQSRWLNVRLQWRAVEAVGQNYAVFVQLLDRNGALVAQHDGIPMAGYAPTSSWQPGSTVNDRHSVALPYDVPSGEYQVLVGLYDPATSQRLPLADGSGDALVLGTISLGE